MTSVARDTAISLGDDPSAADQDPSLDRALDRALDRWGPRVLGYLDEHAADVVGDLRDLVRVPSVSGSDEENTVQHLLRDRLDELGLEVDCWEIPLAQLYDTEGFPGVEVDRREAWGLVGRSAGQGEGRSLMLNAHVDVVPPGDRDAWGPTDPFAGRADAESVYGRGACDMKGGLVAALWAVRALRALDVPLRGDLLMAFVQGEEDGGLGTFATLARGWRADACVIPEPTSLDLVPANAGSLTFRIRIRGAASHASRRTSGVSAIEKLVPVLHALRRLEADRNRTVDPLMGRWDVAYPIELGTVRAGDWASSVPDLLVGEGRMGVALGESVDAAREEFAAAVRAACQADPWLRDHPVEVEWWGGQFTSGLTPVSSPILDSVRWAHASQTNRAPSTWGVPYGSDLRLMNDLGGVPTVHYGPGDAALAHGPRERVSIGEVLTTCRTLALTAMRHCGTG